MFVEIVKKYFMLTNTMLLRDMVITVQGRVGILALNWAGKLVMVVIGMKKVGKSSEKARWGKNIGLG